MDSPDVSRAALERLLTPPEGDRMELVVTHIAGMMTMHPMSVK